MRRIPWLAGGLAALVLVFTSPIAGPQTPPPEDASVSVTTDTSALPGLESFLDGLIGGLMTVHDIPGGAVSVVADGQVVLAKGYGFADVARTVPVDPGQTLFRPGSISKLFTWISVMQLVEQGKLDIDADVNTYLTQFKIPEAFGEPVTLRHILTHTAGFEDGAVGAHGYLFHRSPEEMIGLAEALKTHMPKRVRPPGEFSSYSNWATALAGLIVSNVSGEPFDDYVATHILEPLDMRNSTFREPLPDRMYAKPSAGFYRRAGDYVDGGFEYIHDFGPAGSMSTTAVDMARFMLAMLNDGAAGDQRILQPETAQLMRTRLFSHDARFPGMLYGFFELDINGRPGFGHGGDTVHFHSELMMLPDERFGIFLSFNAPDGGVAAREATAAFFKQYFPEMRPDPHPDPDEATETDAGEARALAAYIGAYRSNRRSYTTFEKVLALGGDTIVSPAPRGGLLVASGPNVQRYTPIGEGVFRSVDDPQARIAFRTNEAGQATHMFVSSFAPIAFERIGWFESSGLHIPLIGLCLIVFVGVAAGTIWGFGKWMRMGPVEKLARGLVFTGSAAFLLFLLGLGLAITAAGEEVVFTGVPGLGVLVWLPLIGLTCAMAATGLVVPIWTGRAWSLFGRVRYTLVVAVLLLASALTVYWNLLGPWVL